LREVEVESKFVAAKLGTVTVEQPGQHRAIIVRFDVAIGVDYNLRDASRQRVRILALSYTKMA
jgi:hypothetical protein